MTLKEKKSLKRMVFLKHLYPSTGELKSEINCKKQHNLITFSVSLLPKSSFI